MIEIVGAKNIFAKQKWWSKINAVKDNRVYSVDTNTSSRASQFSIEALKEIAKKIY